MYDATKLASWRNVGVVCKDPVALATASKLQPNGGYHIFADARAGQAVGQGIDIASLMPSPVKQLLVKSVALSSTNSTSSTKANQSLLRPAFHE